MTPIAPEEPADVTVPRMSRLQIAAVFLVAVALFLLWNGPIWRHAWDLDLFDAAVYWSYLPIPILVAACLAWSKRLRLRAFLLDTLLVVLLKYVTTFALALVLWSAREPKAAAHVRPPPRPALPVVVAAPTGRPVGETAAVRGVVVDASGAPVEGALVFVESGLEGWALPRRVDPVELANDGTGIHPRLAAVQVEQPIAIRSTDGRLHTVVATAADGALFNLPMLRSGAATTVAVHELHPAATLRCVAHQHDAREAPAELIVLENPAFATTAADGRFDLGALPKVRVHVRARHPDGRSAAAELDVGGGEPSLRLAER